MFCNNCGKEIADGAKFCPECGAQVEAPRYESVADDSERTVVVNSQPVPAPQPTYYYGNEAQNNTNSYENNNYDYNQSTYTAPSYNQNANVSPKSKVTAGILALLLGGLGIHKFYLGYTTAGVITLLVTLLTCGIGGGVMGVIALIEGILYLTKTDEEFYETYVVNQKTWF